MRYYGGTRRRVQYRSADNEIVRVIFTFLFVGNENPVVSLCINTLCDTKYYVREDVCVIYYTLALLNMQTGLQKSSEKRVSSLFAHLPWLRRRRRRPII